MPNQKRLHSPPPLLAKLCPSPWAGHSLARRGDGGVDGEAFVFKNKCLIKMACPKMARVSPYHGLKIAKKMVGDKMAYPHACCGGRWVATIKRMGKGKGERGKSGEEKEKRERKKCVMAQWR